MSICRWCQRKSQVIPRIISSIYVIEVKIQYFTECQWEKRKSQGIIIVRPQGTRNIKISWQEIQICQSFCGLRGKDLWITKIGRLHPLKRHQLYPSRGSQDTRVSDITTTYLKLNAMDNLSFREYSSLNLRRKKGCCSSLCGGTITALAKLFYITQGLKNFPKHSLTLQRWKLERVMRHQHALMYINS